MSATKTVRSALLSVYHKDGLEPLARLLASQGVTLYSTGGTLSYLHELGLEAIAVESLTGYPSIFGGRVKTLHPAVFGGILHRREDRNDQAEAQQFHIPAIDMVVVDLYPFEQTAASGAAHEDIIEKIDIGGISLIRAAAKNYHDVVIISHRGQYEQITTLLSENHGKTSLQERHLLAAEAFAISSHYDTAIFHYFNAEHSLPYFKQSWMEGRSLRYGENPHQRGHFFGELDHVFEQLNGKELSYNNLVDVDAALALAADLESYDRPACVIVKHTNACGVSLGDTAREAYLGAYEADSVSAFGGVIVLTAPVDMPVAQELNQLFFEILIAPDYDKEALELLKGKKNRMLLRLKHYKPQTTEFKSLLNGVLAQDKDLSVEEPTQMRNVTTREPSEDELLSLAFALKVCKHTKSNTIVLAKEGQLIASGTGQTSRVDALQQAIAKAHRFGFELKGAVMASDAFFPFADCVEIAHQAGITAVVQPGGSVRDQDSIDYCNANGLAMVFTGVRHFKH